MSMGQTLEGTGCVTWWGFGPARDLLEIGVPRPQGELNVLLVGSGDPRHVLKTIAGLKDTDSLHVWVIENSMEVVARQLLLLYVALSSPGSMGMQEKTEVFLELFGNSEIRSQTADKLKHIAARLFLSVTETMDTDTGAHTHPCLDTTLLKFKERDVLAQIFKQWQRPPVTPLSMSKAWDTRVRQHLGGRYDTRKGCYDWDLAMKLYDRGCGVIQKQEYDRWRESGVAFEIREGLYCIANPSLLSMRVFSRKGDKVGVQGYWGDIVSSPYLSFGIETDDKELLKRQNNKFVKSAQEVSLANLQMLFNSLCTRAGHTHVSQLTRDSIVNTADTQSEKKQDATSHQTDCMIVYSMVHHLDSSLTQTTAPDAVLIVELAKYLLDLSKEQQTVFATKVSEIAQEAGFVPSDTRNDDDAYAMFTLPKDQ
ncbi:Dynein assembly factor 3, axonemal [Bagarius yarrelli]|uniref:Dynein axonemal assembly factor 3 n=1 Tax=Bagarius yarrelli TaxID=175774 RepID=A0A556U1H5_BAGYA|nr:Dynein assembly factor 3, axonemal [Bagarius yarrelli]